MNGNRNTKFEQGNIVIFEGERCEVIATGPNTVGIRVGKGVKWVSNDVVVLAD